MKDILNLGCGNRIIEGAIHHDRVKHRDEITVVHDLNVLPWPWEDESFDHIEAWAVLEHLNPDLVTTINECWRILRPDGMLKIKLPLYDSEVSWTDPTHRWFVTMRTLDYFDPDTDLGTRYTFYTPYKWILVKSERVKGTGSLGGWMRKRTL